MLYVTLTFPGRAAKLTPLTHLRKKVKELRETFENPKMECSNVSHNSFTSFLKCVRGVSFAARPRRGRLTYCTRPCTVEVPGRVQYVKPPPGYLNDTPLALEEQSEGIVWDIRKSENGIFECPTQFFHFFPQVREVCQFGSSAKKG